MSETVISSVLICPKCKYTNPTKSKFCMQCGTPISAIKKPIKKAKLVLIENGNPIKDFPIIEKTVLGKGGDIPIEGKEISRNVCEFSFDEEKVFLKILQEIVFIKANSDKPVELRTGTELRVGEKLFRVEIE